MTRDLRVLYVVRNAFAGGSEIFLLRMIRWLAANTGVDQRVLFGDSGTLMEEFCASAPCWQLRPWSPSILERIKGRIGNHVSLQGHLGLVGGRDLSRRIRREFDPDLIYVNSLQSEGVFAQLGGLDVPMLLHVHELDFWIENNLPERFLNRLIARTSHILAVSDAVARNLVEKRRIDEGKVSVIRGFIPDLAPDKAAKQFQAAEFRAELGLSPSDIVVGGCGARYLGKGIDLFVATAQRVRELNPEVKIHFVWLGGKQQSDDSKWVAQDIARAALCDRVTFLESRPDPVPFYAAIDIFFLSSREDSFPLVCLEAAGFGVPTVAFRNAGGAAEFIREDAGLLVPYLDVAGAASAIVRLARDMDLRNRLGTLARSRVCEEHDIDHGMARVHELMRKVAKADF